MLPDASEEVIMSGSTDIASISWFMGSRCPERPERCPLDEELWELASSETRMARLRRLMMKNAAIRMTIRIATAPPIIPPIAGVVRPLFPAPDALILEEAVCEGVYLPTTPFDWTVSVASGAPRIVDEMMVVVTV